MPFLRTRAVSIKPCSSRERAHKSLSKLTVCAMLVSIKIVALCLSSAAALSLHRNAFVSSTTLAPAVVPSSRRSPLCAVSDKISRRSVLLGTASLASALSMPGGALADDPPPAEAPAAAAASSAATPRAGYSSSADEKAARLKAQQDAFKAKLAAQGATVASASPSSNSVFSFGGGGGKSEPTAEEIARAEKKREQKAIYKAAMEKAKAGRVDGPGLAGTGIFKAPF